MCFLYSQNLEVELSKLLKDRNETHFFLLTDANVARHCLPLISNVIKEFDVKVFTVPAGEATKNINTIIKVWDFLLQNNADRNSSLLINLGGGVVTDMGAFVASTYKRGIPFINIPTTILAAVDASIGGKTGVNFNNYKNQIGSFANADLVVIEPVFFKTLSKREKLNGMAEMFKHAMLSSKEAWENIKAVCYNLHNDNYILDANLLKQSTAVKLHYVKNDPTDKGIRASLNLGHTFGHAFEAVLPSQGVQIKHGEAVVAGMICEAFISHKTVGLPLKILLKITKDLADFYPLIENINRLKSEIVEAMFYDKKNINKTIKATLIKDWGMPVCNQNLSIELINEALNFYFQLQA